MTSIHHEPSIVERSVQAANLWYRDVAADLETEDLRYAASALRVVLHALRDRLPVAESAQLASQLPTLIRGVYFEGWRPGAKHEHTRDVHGFLAHVAADGRMAGETEASHAVTAVSHVLHQHVSEGEMRDVLATLPTELRPLFAD